MATQFDKILSRERPGRDGGVGETARESRNRCRSEACQRIKSGKQIPSPPGLSRTRSTGRDRQPSRFHPVQQPHPIDTNGRVETSQYLSPESIHPREPSPTFAYAPPIPRIVLSEGSIAHDSQYRHRERPWPGNRAAAQSDTSPRSSVTHSSWGVLSDNTYQYDELQRPFEFRLVRLFAAKMSTIKCQIIHESLADPPPYTAISYAWGDPDDRRKIQVNDITVSVTTSLFGALEALRQKGEDRLIWVDALCIDQHSRDERNQQVKLMTEIYAQAEEVAIWLGPEENDSSLAIELLKEIFIKEVFPDQITDLVLSQTRQQAVRAMVSLFQRDYWNRLWVVQEVFNAKAVKVYCGSTKLPWAAYKKAACIFHRYKNELELYFSGGSSPRFTENYSALPSAFSYAQVLAYEGPNSLLDPDSLKGLGEESLLSVMRACRRKLTSEPRDRVFGILGVLPENVRLEFLVNYSLSVKTIYTNVVDFLLCTTERVDCICEAIHFPKRTNNANLPSWLPDWSQNSETTALGHTYEFSAAGNSKAQCKFLDKYRNELEISAIYIASIQQHGVAVGTLCTLADYLMAFLHWRALLLGSVSRESGNIRRMEEAFCRTLSLGQFPKDYKVVPENWVTLCYHIFASQIRSRLPYLPLDDSLQFYADARVKIPSNNPRQFFQSNFGSRMMGRCLCITDEGDIGMGTGFMLPDDFVVVPLGCRTPIIIRKERENPERFRFIGDVYIDGYMHGEIMKRWDSGKTEPRKFVLI